MPFVAKSFARALASLVAISSMLLGGLALNVPLAAVQVAEARPLFAPIASVSLGVPAEGFIGEDVAFTVTFDNASAVDVGYGPYIDLYLPLSGVDGTGSGGVNDGLSLLTASYLGSPVTTFTLDCPSSGSINHPLTGLSTACPAPMAGYTGPLPYHWQLTVIQLPFGSFTNDQPPAPVLVTASMSNRADLGVPLVVQANGGFMFGADPLNNPGTDPVIIGGSTSASITPILLKLKKIYIGPEDETATGPNFPRQYQVVVDIAAGQTITDLLVTDVLSNNVQYLSLDATLVHNGGVATTIVSTPSLVTPGGTLSRRYATVTGTTADDDVEMWFSFYIPLNDSNGDPVLNAATGDDALSLNEALAVGSWQPIDTRDLGGVDNAVADPPGPEHILEDQSIAIQKGNTNISDTVNSPGDIIEYTLEFQISDFFDFRNVIITDTLSDGQHFLTSFVPTLSFSGNPTTYTLATTPFNAANYTHDMSNIGNDLNPATNGSTVLNFRVSDELITNGFDGRMVGGCVPPGGTGGPTPDCLTYNDGATVGTITYRAQILGDFTDTYPSGDSSVDQGDVLSNTALIDGTVLGVADAHTPTGFTEADDTGSGLQIAFGQLHKTIYAINGVVCSPQPCTAVQIAPAYTLTYRLVYDLPISDFEDFSITDYLPLPVFFSTELTVFDPTVSAAPPPAGTVKFGPSDTFFVYSSIVPTMTVDGVANSVRFDYGDFDDPANTPTTVDLLLTVTASSEPFADRLFLTNQAHAAEGSTNAGDFLSDAIVQITLTEPVVRLTKGIVATNNPESFFVPTVIAPPGAGSFTAPGSPSCPRFSGTITSTALITNPINSDLHNVDQFDRVTFGILVENIGTGLHGAFDVVITDSLPISFHVPAGGLNLCVTNGAGAPITTTGFLTSGLEFVDPAPLVGALTAFTTTGTNLALITFDMEADGLLPASVFTNTTSLSNTAGVEGGPNHITTTTPGRTDNALLFNWPLPSKQLISTEIMHANNLLNQVVIGEIITYQVDIRIPEGIVENLTLVDTLDAGLAFVGLVGFQNSNPVSITQGITPVVPSVGPGGSVITFTFGTVTNTATTNPLLEHFTLTYTAVTLNVIGNQAGTLRNNLATVQWSLAPQPGQQQVTASAPNVLVIEPTVGIQKSVTPALVDSGDVFTYQIVISNSGLVDAFGVVLTDTLPATGAGSLILDPALVSVDDSAALVTSANFALLGSNATSWALSTTVPFDMLVGPRLITLTITGTAPIYLPLGTTINNRALVRWTSLPGDVSTPRSAFNPAAIERTGADGPGGALNDYATEANALFATTGYALDKRPVTPSNYTIGEVVTYTIVMTLPEGVTPGLIITDSLPGGLAYVSHQVITSAAASGGALGANYNGTINTTPVFTNSASGLAFDFGDVTTAADNNGGNNAFALRIVAQVRNVITNQIGTLLTNTASASLVVLGNRITVDDPTPVVIAVVEPVLFVYKTMPNFTPGTVITPGDTLTYTVLVAHTGASQVPAFDVVITDVLQSDFINITVIGAQRSDGLPLTSQVVGQEIRVPASPATFDLPLGMFAKITYTVQINPASTAVTITNAAYASWSTLDGGVPEERVSGDGFLDGGGLNDYLAAHGVFINIGQPTVIELASFTATAAGDTVTLAWETAVEIDTAGFNLYRAATADGPRTLVNPLLIAATGSGGGAQYSWPDQPGAGVWYYWLEDIDTHAVATLHGPVTATVGTPENALHRIYLVWIGR